MLLVKATVTGPSQSVSEISGVVPVSAVEVLTGTLPNGAVKYVQQSTTGGNALPEGRYLLLLGAFADRPSTYYLAGGMQGSFVVNGNGAAERCPDYNDPQNPVLASQTVPLNKLTANFAKAIHEYGATPLPHDGN